MRTLLFAFTVFVIGLTSCKSTESEPSQQTQEPEKIATSRGVTTANDAISKIVEALKNQDSTTLNKYIDTEKGLYLVLSTQGSYSDCTHYNSALPIFQDGENSSEYDAHPLTYLMDYLNNVDINEMEIIQEDLFGIDACSFHENGFFLDSNETDIKLLTEVYTMNIERDGNEINPTELVKLGETQNEVSKTLYIGDGEVTYTLYLTEKDGQWSVTIMDFRDCDT